MANHGTCRNHSWNLLSHLINTQSLVNRPTKTLPTLRTIQLQSSPPQIHNPVFPPHATQPLTITPTMDLLQKTAHSHPTLRTTTPLHLPSQIPPQLHITKPQNTTHQLCHLTHATPPRTTQLFQKILR